MNNILLNEVHWFELLLSKVTYGSMLKIDLVGKGFWGTEAQPGLLIVVDKYQNNKITLAVVVCRTYPYWLFSSTVARNGF